MKDQRVTLITLGVGDLERSKAFYAKLGWTPDDTTPQVAFYDLGGMRFGLFGRDDLAKDQGREGTPLGTGAMTLAQNFPDKPSVDTAFERAIAAGATILKRPEEVFWGGYSGYFADPDGHVWELAFNPFWDLGKDGKLV